METVSGSETTGTDGITDTGPADEAPAKQRRERSTIGFTYDDLASALRLTAVVHNTYYGSCSADQLGAALGTKWASGTFRLRVSAGRLFGVLGGSGTDITTTDLGIRALDDADTGAKAEAFLNVPLFAKLFADFSGGRTLPDDAGLEARIRALGVSAKQVTTARQVFMRSAEQAGFFTHGRTQLVMPPRGKVTPVDDRQDGGGGDGGGADDEQEGPAIMKHPLIQGLLAVLPEPGEDFPPEDREMWLRTLDMNLSFIYGRPSKVQPSQTATAVDHDSHA